MTGEVSNILKPNQQAGYLSAWFLVLSGWATLYAPTYHQLANSIWQSSSQAHAPLVGFATLVMLISSRNSFLRTRTSPRPSVAALCVSLALGLAFIGISQQVTWLILFSQSFMLGAGLYLAGGATALRMLWFPIAFLFLMVPLPGAMINDLTTGLTIRISQATEFVLYGFGYPVARSGATLIIGQYQLLVADACSGLNSLTALSVIGTLYLKLSGHRHPMCFTILLLALLPIALMGNLVRVIALLLLTYHFGDEMRVIAHQALGFVVFAWSIVGFIGLDILLKGRSPQQHQLP